MKSARILRYVVLPLILGWMLYQLRPLGNGWIDNLSIRSNSWRDRSFEVPDFVIYNLADGLWSFALSAFILIIWENHLIAKRLWLIAVFIFVIGIEFLQKGQLLEGTFDNLDVLANVTGFALSILILSYYKTTPNYETTLT